MFRRCGQISIIAWIEQDLASDQNRFWTFKNENATFWISGPNPCQINCLFVTSSKHIFFIVFREESPRTVNQGQFVSESGYSWFWGVLIVHLKICFCWKLVFQLRQIRLNLTKFCDTFDWSNFQFGSDTVTTVSFSITVPTINQTLKMLIPKFKNYIAGTILFQLFFSNTVIYSILTFCEKYTVIGKIRNKPSDNMSDD